jgi:predicted DNA-binding transcriptional regulator AlpA
MLPEFDIVASIPRSRIPAVVTALMMRLAEPEEPAQPMQSDTSDLMLTTEEAAALLRRSPRWIYRNARKLPFVRRLSARSMVHSRKGIERYLASRKG